MIRTGLLLFFLAQAGHAAVARAWPSASGTAVIVFIVLSIAAGVVIGAIQIVQYWRGKIEREKAAWERFDMASLNLSLGNAEMETLKRIIRHGRLGDPESIFRNLLAFETGVAREIDSHLEDTSALPALSDTIAGLRDKMGYVRPRLPAGTRLFSSREVSPEQSVTLSRAADPAAKRYNAEVRGQSELEFLLAVPESEEAAAFQPGVQVFVSLFQPKDAEYSFPSRVLRSERNGRWLSLAHVPEMRRRQLREYIRLECHNEAAFRLVRSDAAPEAAKEGKRYMGLLNDIGGGGVNLRAAEAFHVGDELLLSFTFMGENFFGIKGRIVRQLPRTVHGEQVFQNHISFIEMDNAVREKIIKLIFKKQREETPWRT